MDNKSNDNVGRMVCPKLNGLSGTGARKPLDNGGTASRVSTVDKPKEVSHHDRVPSSGQDSVGGSQPYKRDNWQNTRTPIRGAGESETDEEIGGSGRETTRLHKMRTHRASPVVTSSNSRIPLALWARYFGKWEKVFNSNCPGTRQTQAPICPRRPRRTGKVKTKTIPCDNPPVEQKLEVHILWQHNGSTRGGGGTCGFWNWVGQTRCAVREARGIKENWSTTRVHLAKKKLRTKHSRCSRCWQNETGNNLLLPSQSCTKHTPPTTPDTRRHTKNNNRLDVPDAPA